jgi:hypothetical protein
VRKASRTLAFLSVRAETPGAAAGHVGEDRSQVVQAVLEHEAGWRRACGEDGRRVCCGAVLSLWGDLERDVSPGSSLSLLVRGGLVRSSPHDSISAAGGVKQHAEVERAAAAAAVCTPHCVRVRGDAGTGRQQQRSGLPLPLCKQWWKARVDGKACVCATRGSNAGPDDDEEREAGVIGACGRRHYFASAEEDAKYRLLEEKRQRSRELERAGIQEDPHSACSKLKKAHSDGLFVDWLLVSLPPSLSPSPFLPFFPSSVPFICSSFSSSLPTSVHAYMYVSMCECVYSSMYVDVYIHVSMYIRMYIYTICMCACATSTENTHTHRRTLTRTHARTRARTHTQATYGEEELRRGGIVDVAGGKGEISFRLVHHHNIPCTLVDPRPVRLLMCT